MNTWTRKIVIVAVLLVVAFAGVRAFHMFFRKPDGTDQAKQTTQAMNPLGPYGQPGRAIPDMSSIVGNQAAAFKLMTQYGVDMGTATYLAQAKAQVLSQTNTSVHFLLTLPDGITSDQTITLTPDVRYTPTQAELAQAANGGKHIYNVKFTATNESDTKAHMTLQYFVPYSDVPADLQRRIHGQSSSLEWLDPVPSVWAQESGGGGLGMGVYQDTATEVAKEVLKQQAEHGKLSKEFPTPLARLVDVLNAFKKEQEHVGWLEELDELQDCAENPTNPVTKKAFDQDPAYRDQVTHGVTQARGDVTGLTGMRFVNLATSVATDLVEGPLGAITSPVASLNDETLKELAERRISDAKLGVTPCHHEQMTAGQFRPMQANFKYAYNRIIPNVCDNDGRCSQGEEKKGLEGTVHMTPDSTGLLVGKGTAEITMKQEQHATNEYGCRSEGHQTSEGVGELAVRGGGATPLNGVVKAEFRTEALTTDGEGKTCKLPPGHSHTENGSFGMYCDFYNVNFVRGGTYTAFEGGNEKNGTCTLEIFPE